MIIVRNKKQVSNRVLPEGYNSWLEYYEVESKNKSPQCSNLICFDKAKVGAHVDVVGEKGDHITPFCKSCSTVESDIDVVKNWVIELK